MAPYQNAIFVNLPVSNLERSIAFYTAIGFVQTKAGRTSPPPKSAMLTVEAFSNDKAVMMSLPAFPSASTTGPQAHEGPIKIMLLTKPFFQKFLPASMEIADQTKVAQTLVCVSRESKEAVDAFVEAAAKNGGKKDIRPKNEEESGDSQGGMYGGVVSDPDGHILEAVYMAKEAYEGAE